MTNDQKSRIKQTIMLVASEILNNGGSPDDLYDIQDFLSGIDAFDGGLDFGDGEEYTIKQLRSL